MSNDHANARPLERLSFHEAAATGYLPIVKDYIKRGEDYKQRDENGWTPLMWAVRKNNYHVVDALLNVKERDKDLYVNMCDEDGYTALMLAVEQGMVDVVQLLLSNRALLSFQNKFGYTALSLAYLHGFEDIAQLLVQRSEVLSDAMGVRVVKTPRKKSAPKQKKAGLLYETDEEREFLSMTLARTSTVVEMVARQRLPELNLNRAAAQHVTTVPFSSSRLRHLQVVELSGCGLTSLPRGLFCLVSLTRLNLAHN
eukprot:Colp12_sorted_trinity150504_noHs@9009